jgi:hypothetical protein
MVSLSIRFLAAFGLILGEIAAPAAHAQILYGSLVGNVKDSTDAVVAGAAGPNTGSA